MRSEGLELHHLRPFLLHVVDGDLERGGGEGRFEFLIIIRDLSIPFATMM